MRNKTRPVHQPEKRNDEQDADTHGQSGHEPQFFLVFGTARFSPASVLIMHNAIIDMSGSAHPPLGVHPIRVWPRKAVPRGFCRVNP